MFSHQPGPSGRSTPRRKPAVLSVPLRPGHRLRPPVFTRLVVNPLAPRAGSSPEEQKAATFVARPVETAFPGRDFLSGALGGGRRQGHWPGQL